MFKFFTRKFLNGQSRTITSAALILGLASMASRFLGLIRDRLLAGHFGAGDSLDIYYAAFRVPDLIYNLLIMGTLSAGFIPVFISLWEKKTSEESWKFVNSILNILMLGMIALGVLFFILTPYFMKLLTPGFSGQKLEMTIALTRIMFLSPILLGISSIWGAVLQSLKRFLVFSLSPIFYNLGIIFGILFLVPRFGLYGLAYGVVLGAFFHMLIQLPAVIMSGYKYDFVFGWAKEPVRRLARLMVPRVLTLAVSQLNFAAITAIASVLAAGSLAVFNLSYNIWSFPLGIISASLATAAFPSLAQHIAKNEREEFSKTFSATMRQILFLIIPSSALFIVLRAQIVRVILGTGKFNWTDTQLTISSLEFLTLGLFAESLILLLVRGFFAFEDTKTPFWIGFVSSFFRIGGALVLSRYMGVSGLALGYAGGGIINLLFLWFFLERKAGDLRSKDIFYSSIKIVIASFLAGLTAYILLQYLVLVFNTHKTVGLFMQGFLAGCGGIIVYFLAGLILGSQEMYTFWQTIKHRLPFRLVLPLKEYFQD